MGHALHLQVSYFFLIRNNCDIFRGKDLSITFAIKLLLYNYWCTKKCKTVSEWTILSEYLNVSAFRPRLGVAVPSTMWDFVRVNTIKGWVKKTDKKIAKGDFLYFTQYTLISKSIHSAPYKLHMCKWNLIFKATTAFTYILYYFY